MEIKEINSKSETERTKAFKELGKQLANWAMEASHDEYAKYSKRLTMAFNFPDDYLDTYNKK